MARSARFALLGLVACTLAGPAHADDRVRMGPPSLSADAQVRWAAAPAWSRPLARARRADSIRVWSELLRRPGLAALAHVRLGELALTAGDSAALREHASAVEAARAPWEWPALALRLREGRLRRDPLAARRALQSAAVASAGWIPEERVAYLQQSLALALAANDTDAARAGALSLVRVAVATRSIDRGVHVLDSLTRATHTPLSANERRAMAAALGRSGRHLDAVRVLRPLVAEAANPSEVWRSIGDHERRARRWSDARVALDQALARATQRGDSSAAWLERARLSRARGDTPAALDAYARAAPASPDDASAALALWERGQLAMAGARWEIAEESFARLAAGVSPRAGEARVRAGVAALAAGDAERAVRIWEAGSDEGARFWWASGRRMQARTRGAARDTLADAALAAIAATPGYTFYRAAARDTLGVTSWPAAVALPGCVPDSACGTLQDSETLAALGADREALTLLFQVFGRVPLAVPADARTREARLGAARIGYALGEPFHAARWAREAAWNGDQISRIAPRPGATIARDASRWGVEPWMAPPAWQTHVLDVADSLALEPELLWAVMELESRFQWDARSPSGALGLMQLLLPAASDAARWAHERRPNEARVLDPASNVRYGGRYLAWLMGRFDGHVTVALSAYNAGPSTVPLHWRELIARGGDALFAEIASNEDAQFYAKWIVAGLRAYRDARPRLAPR